MLKMAGDVLFVATAELDRRASISHSTRGFGHIEHSKSSCRAHKTIVGETVREKKRQERMMKPRLLL